MSGDALSSYAVVFAELRSRFMDLTTGMLRLRLSCLHMHNGLVSKARLAGLVLLLAFPHVVFGQAAFVSVPVAFPQIAVGGDPLGSHYVTFLQVVNNTSAFTNGHVDLLSDAGGAFPALIDGEGPMSAFDVSLGPGETVQVAISSSDPVASGWMKVTYSPSVALTSVLVQYLSGNTLLSQVGVDPAFNTVLSTDLPFETDTSLNNGIAISNPSTATAYIFAGLYDSADGNFLIGKTITLPGNGHLAQLVTEIFSAVPNISQMRAKMTLISCSDSNCAFTGGNGFLATALRLNNDQFTTIPVVAGSSTGNMVRFLPHVAFGGPDVSHMDTVLYFTTNLPTGVIATADIFDNDGNPLSASANGSPPAASIPIAVLSNRVTKIVLTGDSTLRSGWIRLTLSGSVNLVTNAIFQTFNENSLVSEASVLESPAVQRGLIYVDTRSGSNEGVAFGNAGPDLITVSLDLFDQQGNLVVQHDYDIPANGHLAQFVTEYFPELESLPDFTGSMAIHSANTFSCLALRLTGDKLATMPISTDGMHRPSIVGLRTTGSLRFPAQVSFSVDLADADADLPSASSAIAAAAALDFGGGSYDSGGFTIDGTAMLNRNSATLGGSFRPPNVTGTVQPQTPAVLYLQVYDSLGNASNVVGIPFKF